MRYKFLNADGKFSNCNDSNCKEITVIRDSQTDLDFFQLQRGQLQRNYRYSRLSNGFGLGS